MGGVGDILPPPHARAEKAIVSNQKPVQRRLRHIPRKRSEGVIELGELLVSLASARWTVTPEDLQIQSVQKLGGSMTEQDLAILSSDRLVTLILQEETREKLENTPSKRGRSISPSRRTTPDPSGPSSTREHVLGEDQISAPDPFLGVEKERRLKEMGRVDAW